MTTTPGLAHRLCPPRLQDSGGAHAAGTVVRELGGWETDRSFPAARALGVPELGCARGARRSREKPRPAQPPGGGEGGGGGLVPTPRAGRAGPSRAALQSGARPQHFSAAAPALAPRRRRRPREPLATSPGLGLGLSRAEGIAPPVRVRDRLRGGAAGTPLGGGRRRETGPGREQPSRARRSPRGSATGAARSSHALCSEPAGARPESWNAAAAAAPHPPGRRAVVGVVAGPRRPAMWP